MSEQLKLFPVTEPRSEDRSVTVSVTERQTAKFKAIQRFLNDGKSNAIACICKYRPSKRKNNYYYRLSYRSGNKVKHCHIPGGNVNSELANYRVDKLQAMIERGAEVPELLAAIVDYRGVK